MFSYKFDLRSLGYSEEDYDKTAIKAQVLARNASAVDTGLFKRGWVSRVNGDILTVSNAVRYAPFVELGSAVYRFHRYKVKRALESLGLTRGKEQFGPGLARDFSTGDKTGPSKETREGSASPSTGLPTPPPVQPITEQEIRSPALLLQRFRIPRVPQTVVPRSDPRIPKAQLFNRSRLLELIIAAEIVNENINNEETQ
jgi:hypothetical protein